MVEKSNKNPSRIVYGGKNKNSKWGILVKPEFFDDKISNYEKGSECWLEKCCSFGEVFTGYSESYSRL
jgi:hypothetical protein